MEIKKNWLFLEENLYERIKFSTDGNILTRQMWMRWQQS